MLTSTDIIETFLDSGGFTSDDSTVSLNIGSSSNNTDIFTEPGYEGSIDYRIRQLSYSSMLSLHTCPRKYELYKKRTTSRLEQTQRQSITFAFGHAVGEAIQLALENVSEKEIIWRMFCNWDTDILAEDTKGQKSFWGAVIALKRFLSLREQGLLSEYELVYHKGKPACELSFCITFPDGFRYRGFVDAVLRHKNTNKILVLECKTTGSAALNPSKFKNSAQAIGYSVVLDVLFPTLSSYDVLYLIYQTPTKDYISIPFTKTYLQRALWIRELLLDIEQIKSYEAAGIYPMHGENCYQYATETEKGTGVYSGECEYINSCTMSNSYLVKKASEADLDTAEYQVNLTLLDLLENQLSKLGE